MKKILFLLGIAVSSVFLCAEQQKKIFIKSHRQGLIWYAVYPQVIEKGEWINKTADDYKIINSREADYREINGDIQHYPEIIFALEEPKENTPLYHVMLKRDIPVKKLADKTFFVEVYDLLGQAALDKLTGERADIQKIGPLAISPLRATKKGFFTNPVYEFDGLKLSLKNNVTLKDLEFSEARYKTPQSRAAANRLDTRYTAADIIMLGLKGLGLPSYVYDSHTDYGTLGLKKEDTPEHIEKRHEELIRVIKMLAAGKERKEAEDIINKAYDNLMKDVPTRVIKIIQQVLRVNLDTAPALIDRFNQADITPENNPAIFLGLDEKASLVEGEEQYKKLVEKLDKIVKDAVLRKEALSVVKNAFNAFKNRKAATGIQRAYREYRGKIIAKKERQRVEQERKAALEEQKKAEEARRIAEAKIKRRKDNEDAILQDQAKKLGKLHTIVQQNDEFKQERCKEVDELSKGIDKSNKGISNEFALAAFSYEPNKRWVSIKDLDVLLKKGADSNLMYTYKDRTEKILNWMLINKKKDVVNLLLLYCALPDTTSFTESINTGNYEQLEQLFYYSHGRIEEFIPEEIVLNMLSREMDVKTKNRLFDTLIRYGYDLAYKIGNDLWIVVIRYPELVKTLSDYGFVGALPEEHKSILLGLYLRNGTVPVESMRVLLNAGIGIIRDENRRTGIRGEIDFAKNSGDANRRANAEAVEAWMFPED